MQLRTGYASHHICCGCIAPRHAHWLWRPLARAMTLVLTQALTLTWAWWVNTPATLVVSAVWVPRLWVPRLWVWGRTSVLPQPSLNSRCPAPPAVTAVAHRCYQVGSTTVRRPGWVSEDAVPTSAPLPRTCSAAGGPFPPNWPHHPLPLPLPPQVRWWRGSQQ